MLVCCYSIYVANYVFIISSHYAFSVFAVYQCLQSKQQGYIVVFMQLILSVDNFWGQVVSIFIVDWCRPQNFVC